MSDAPATIYRRRLRVAPEELPFPTPAQLDLVKAATMPAPQAAEAWTRWKGRGMQLERVDGPSGRIFSQLWLNHAAAGIAEADHALLRGVYRQALAHNAVTITQGFTLTDALSAAGIPVVFLKGTATLAVAGGRLGLRRTMDVDVLVPERDAERAIATVMAAGAQPRFALSAMPRRRHACSFVLPSGADLDLHWWAYKGAGDDAEVFEGARERTLLGRSILIPSATELLIGAVVNGFGGQAPAAPLRWIADTLMLLQLEGSQVDWDAVVRRAERPGLTLGLARGLAYLVEEFDANVPTEALVALARRRVTRRERVAHWAGEHDPRFGGRLLYELELHRTRRRHDPSAAPRDLIGHLAQVTGTGSGSRRRFATEQARRSYLRLRSNAALPTYDAMARPEPADGPERA